MFRVELAGRKLGRDVANVYRDNRLVGAASVPFIKWMAQKVPPRQLSPEQRALTQWLQDREAS